MSLANCIRKLFNAKKITAEQADRAQAMFDVLEAELIEGGHPPELAGVLAGDETLRILQAGNIEVKRQTLLQAVAQNRLVKAMFDFRDARGLKDIFEAAIALYDAKGVAARTFSVDARMTKLRSSAYAQLDEALLSFRSTFTGGARNRAQLLNVVREMHGKNTGDVSAREMAKAFSEVFESLRKQYNAAGGHIAKRSDFGAPQLHNQVEVRNATPEEWKAFVTSRLAREKMIDPMTGQAFSAEKLSLVLDEVYETIASDGWNKVKPSGATGGRALANKRADHRFLVFRGADEWIQYQERFGEGDFFSAFTSHIDGMAKDIALLQQFGPNPTATLRFLQQTVEKEARALQRAGDKKALGRASRTSKNLESLHANFTGAANSPVGGKAPRYFASVRQAIVSIKLGSAAISAVSDLGFQRMAARHNGLSQAKILNRMVRLMNPANQADRKLAVRLGLLAEEWSKTGSAQARFTGEIFGEGLSRRMAETVLRASGLSPWTQYGRWAFGMEFMGTLSDMSGKAFGDLDPMLQGAFKTYNISPADWDLIRRVQKYEPDKGGFIRPEEIADIGGLAPGRADELATKVLTMVLTETEFAVPTVSLRGKSTILGDARPGTVLGEAARSSLLFKNFAISVYFTHVRRAMNQQGLLNKAGYAGNLVITSTLMGALAVQMKEITRGKDPIPMFGENAGKFWPKALLQGGGLGIFGDFFFASESRFGGGFAQTLAGPVVGFGSDVLGLTAGNVIDLVKGEDLNLGADAVRFLRRNTPGGSIWYARLAFERGVLDQLQLLIDPKAKKRFKRLERKIKREYGQDFFLPPGQLVPDRAPDLSKALEEK